MKCFRYRLDKIQGKKENFVIPVRKVQHGNGYVVVATDDGGKGFQVVHVPQVDTSSEIEPPPELLNRAKAVLAIWSSRS